LKHLNKILIVFFTISFITIYGGWRFISSKEFSKKASIKVSEILTKKFGAKLAFTGVDFSIFPPATIFKKVHLEKNDPELANIDLNMEELIVSFTYSSFFSSNLEIDELTMRNGALELNTHKKNTPDINWKDINFNNIFKEYLALLKKSPIQLNIARLENINVQVDSSNFLIDSLSLAPHRKDVLIKAVVSKMQIVQLESDIPRIELDKSEVFIRFDKNKLKVEKLHLEANQNNIDLDAEFFNVKKLVQFESKSTFSLNIESLIPLYSKIPKAFSNIAGVASGKFHARGDFENYSAEMQMEAKRFKSDWIELQNIKAELKKEKNIILVDKFVAQNFNEQYELLKPQALFNIKKNTLLHIRLPIYLRSAFTNTFLRTLQGSLGTLKGYLTGVVDIVLDGDKTSFEIHEKMLVKDFKLLSNSSKPILQNPGFNINEAIFSLDKNLNLGISATLAMHNTLIKADGDITNKGLNLVIKDSKIDMKSFGSIGGLAINGSGPVEAKIYGPFNDVKFDFDIDWNNFSIVDLNFGKIKSDFTLSLKNLQLDINNLNGMYNKTDFKIGGFLNFGVKSEMDISLDVQSTNFSDARKMYALIFKNIKLPLEPEFNFSTKYRVTGGYSLDNLKIEGKILGNNLKVFDEDAEKFSLDFSLSNSLLTFKDIKINKSHGEINANVSVNLANNYTELEGSLKGLRLHDFNFYPKLKIEYDGDLVVDFDGNGTKENFSSRFKTKILDPIIGNIPSSPSSAIIYANTDELTVNANLLSGRVKVDSITNFNTRIASIKSTIDANDIHEILAVFAGNNISEKNIAGKIKADLNTQYNIDTKAVNKFLLKISQFNLKRGDINLSIDSKYNTVAIENGVVKTWDLRFYDKIDFLKSKAKNLSNGAIVFDQSFSLNAGFLELASSSIVKGIGVMKGTNQIIVNKSSEMTKFEISGKKTSLKIKNLPGAITELDFGIIKKANLFEISQFAGKYGDGDFNISGNMIFNDNYPTLNIDYKVERSTISLFKRSSLLVSSSGTITGSDLPYNLKGKLSLLYGEFLDDPSDFTKDSKVNLAAFKKYLPSNDVATKKGYLNVNVTFDTINPILLKNNLAEVYAKGSGQFTGDVLDPEINARIEVIPSVSKFKFKGHDFLLSQGYVDIKDRGKARTSDLKFTGLAKISDYDVKLDISGSIEKSVINLSSEPALAQEDLVSLLTLGVTSDMSKNLEASDRKSVTTVGIGTLLVDQLKINEDLNSTLGLNLSVLPEFKEDESSLVSGKSAVSEGSTSKLKTATKIKIKKQISKQVDVSLSSTVGGSIEQTQEMNINFNLNKNFSIEGVYEVKPSEEENTTNSNSVGADLKYRRSF